MVQLQSGYRFEKFSQAGYDNVVRRGRDEYLAGQERYDESLFRMIDNVAEWSRETGQTLVHHRVLVPR